MSLCFSLDAPYLRRMATLMYIDGYDQPGAVGAGPLRYVFLFATATFAFLPIILVSARWIAQRAALAAGNRHPSSARQGMTMTRYSGA